MRQITFLVTTFIALVISSCSGQRLSLIDAIQNGSLTQVQAAIARGEDVNIRNKDGYPAITLAVYRGDPKIVEALITAKVNLNAPDNSSWTPLMSAAQSGRIEIVRILIQGGANPNQGNTANSIVEVPLTIASLSERIDVIKQLLKDGATTGKDKAFLIAIRKGNQEAFDLLLDQDSPLKEALIDTARYGRKTMFDRLLGLDAKPSNEALIVAAQGGRLDMVKELIERGVNVNEQLLNGKTALIAAAQSGHLDLVQLFLDRGANINVTYEVRRPDSEIVTALTSAIQYRHDEIALLLLEHGADPFQGLVTAVKVNNLNMVKLFIERGSDINENDLRGLTPLLIATQHNNIEMADFLLTNNADPYRMDENGRTALEFAREKQFHEIEQLLIKAGTKKLDFQ